MFPKAVVEFDARNRNLQLAPKHFERPPGKNGKWIYEHSELPWLQLDLDVPYEAMHREALQFFDESVEQDYPGVTYEDPDCPQQRGWRTICIHGISALQYDRASVYGYEHEDEAPYRFTEIADRCPVTKAFLSSLPYEKLYRARFTTLMPQGYAAPHIGRKKNADYSHKISFALNHPEGFRFTMDKQGAIPWRAGRCFLLNVDENYHCVVNESEVPRIHLITMGKPDWKKISPLLERSYYSREMEPKRP
jgi:hypothetical protein